MRREGSCGGQERGLHRGASHPLQYRKGHRPQCSLYCVTERATEMYTVKKVTNSPWLGIINSGGIVYLHFLNKLQTPSTTQ